MRESQRNYGKFGLTKQEGFIMTNGFTGAAESVRDSDAMSQYLKVSCGKNK
jgi:hypothetical protein